MYLLDSTHCIYFIYGQMSIHEKLNLYGDSSISTCVIARGELLYGAYVSDFTMENFSKVENFMKDMTVYPIDDDTANIYGQLKREIIKQFGPKDRLKRRSFKFETSGFKENDLWIASVAVQHGLILVSEDTHLHRLQGLLGLKVENWNPSQPTKSK